jgi:Flp pilus assembly protein TadB
MHDTNRRGRHDRFGLIVALVGALVFVGMLALTLPPLSRWLDTLIVMATLFCPVIVAGLLYNRIERRGGWSHTSRLR